MTAFSQTLIGWHDFYLLVGTAAATLIGLLFVAASLGLSQSQRRSRRDIDAFVTPSVAYFGEAVLLAAIAVAPIDRPATLGGLYLGLLSINVPFGMVRLRYLVGSHREDALGTVVWFWQYLLPVLAQVTLGLGGLGLVLRLPSLPDACVLIAPAIAVTLLVVIGVRNSWYLVVWLLERRET